MRSLRAIVEASRGINPKDQSPASTKARILNSLAELNGLEFGVVVDCEKPSVGDKYVNNTIKKVITPDHEFYAKVMAGEESISAEPLPVIPASHADPKPGWAAAPQGNEPWPAASTPPPSAGSPTNQKPNWM
jgi:hypothetical protein